MPVVTSEFVVGEDIASFDREAFRAGLLSLFPHATKIQVDTSTAGSVRVIARIVMPDVTAANDAVRSIRQTNASALSDALGTQISEPPVAVSANEMFAAPTPPMPPHAPPLAPGVTLIQTTGELRAALASVSPGKDASFLLAAGHHFALDGTELSLARNTRVSIFSGMIGGFAGVSPCEPL